MSDYRLVVAVSNPASVDPLIRMGSALARANNGSLIITSVTDVPPQIPVMAGVTLASQQEAIIERALSVADSVGISAEGKAPPSQKPSRSIVSLVEDTDATGLLVGSDNESHSGSHYSDSVAALTKELAAQKHGLAGI